LRTPIRKITSGITIAKRLIKPRMIFHVDQNLSSNTLSLRHPGWSAPPKCGESSIYRKISTLLIWLSGRCSKGVGFLL